MQPFEPQTTPQLYGQNPGLPSEGHEVRDVNVRAVLIFLLALAVCGIFVFIICLGVYRAYNSYITKQDGAAATWNAQQDQDEMSRKSSMEQQGANRTAVEQSTYQMRTERFPQPRLQTDDVRDMQILRDEEDLQLGNYMWADQRAGKVVIPIDRAMEIIAQRGLPSIANAQPSNVAAPYTLGVTRVESNSSHNPKH